VPVTEGEFSQNPTGQTTVPYDQVYQDYSDAANRALESDYIPLGLRDVVRDYFSALEGLLLRIGARTGEWKRSIVASSKLQ